MAEAPAATRGPASHGSGRSVLERAFALARSGTCANKTAILEAMRREGYSSQDLDALHGTVLSRQLRDLCRQATA